MRKDPSKVLHEVSCIISSSTMQGGQRRCYRNAQALVLCKWQYIPSDLRFGRLILLALERWQSLWRTARHQHECSPLLGLLGFGIALYFWIRAFLIFHGMELVAVTPANQQFSSKESSLISESRSFCGSQGCNMPCLLLDSTKMNAMGCTCCPVLMVQHHRILWVHFTVISFRLHAIWLCSSHRSWKA